MKKSLLLVLSAAFLSTSLMAGGIMTNTNQSAAYARLLARNASLGIDAVYYNPAGLTKLKDGFHLSLNNQSIFQTKDVTNNYPYLHGAPTALYRGDVAAPLFPGIYAAYKLDDKVVLSFGFNPVGGGGGATYDKGLPSFEIPISDLVPLLQPNFGVTDYSADINFEGSSVYFGYQFGVSYKVNEAISLFAGMRAVSAKNTYKGAIRNIQLNPNGTLQPTGVPGLPPKTFNGSFIKAQTFGQEASAYYTQASAIYNGVSQQYTTAAQGAAQLTAGGAGSLTYAQAAGAGIITAAQQAQFEAALVGAGQPKTTPIAQSQVVYTQTATSSANGAKLLSAGAQQLNGITAATGDTEVDVTQTGTGYTPMFGANLTIAEKLTVALKYEMITKLTLVNETVKGEQYFPDSATTRADMPAMLSVGLSYPITKKFVASLGMNYYWDKKANYGKTGVDGKPVSNESVIDKNFFEYAFGLEYSISDKFLISAGYQGTITGVTEAYQTDLSYSLSTGTVGGGVQIGFSDRFALNLGGLYTMYKDDEKNYTHTQLDKITTVPVNEKYAKSTWLVAVGLDVRIGK